MARIAMTGALVFTHWWVMLSIFHQAYAPTFPPSEHFDARGQYVAISGVSLVGGTRLYKFDGSSLSLKGSSTASVAVVGNRYLWTEGKDFKKVCARALGSFSIVKCFDAPSEIQHMSFGRGMVYLEVADQNYSGPFSPTGNTDHVNIYGIREDRPTIGLITKDLETFPKITWCAGADAEYTYWSSNIRHFSGVRSFSIARQGWETFDSCADQNSHVAVIMGKHLWVDGKERSAVDGDVVFPFPNGWLTETRDTFAISNITGTAIVDAGALPTGLRLYRNDGPLYLQALTPGY